MLALLLATGAAMLWRLSEMIVPDMDEGIYVYAGKLISEGARPYRDFMLAHPPLVPYLASVSWKASGGSLMATRLLAIAITLASCIPIHLLAWRIARSATAGLVAVSIYLAGLIWIAHLGRTLRLEPVQNALLIAGVAAWMLGKGRASALAAGLLLGTAVATKLTSVVPVALLATADLAWPAGGSPPGRRRWMAIAGGLLVLAPVGAWCVAQPGFVDWALAAQLGRPRESMGHRAGVLGEALARFPLLLPAVLYAAWQLRARDPHRRVLAVIGLGSAITSVTLFATFFRQYLVTALPWLAVLGGAGVVEAFSRRWRRTVAIAAAVVAVASPILFSEISLRRAPVHSSGAASVIPFLESGNGFLLTSAPDFALVSGRTLVPWYFTVDNYLGRVTGRLSDAEFASAVLRAGTVVLYAGEASRLPRVLAVLGERFRRLPVHPTWEAWEAIDPPLEGRSARSPVPDPSSGASPPAP